MSQFQDITIETIFKSNDEGRKIKFFRVTEKVDANTTTIHDCYDLSDLENALSGVDYEDDPEEGSFEEGSFNVRDLDLSEDDPEADVEYLKLVNEHVSLMKKLTEYQIKKSFSEAFSPVF